MKHAALALAALVALGSLGPASAAAPEAKAAAAPAMKTGTGVGVITEIDLKDATVTVKHEPIPALGWPSMTMPFRVNPPSLLDGLKVGQKIGFDANEGHGLPEITAIRKP